MKVEFHLLDNNFNTFCGFEVVIVTIELNGCSVLALFGEFGYLESGLSFGIGSCLIGLAFDFQCNLGIFDCIIVCF